MKGFNDEVESDDINANRMATGVGLMSATLAATATATLLPGDSGLDQEGVGPGYVAGR